MNYDLLIAGNGLASNLFVRHLLLLNPNLKIVIVGPKNSKKFKVGESLTEGASHYLQHRLKLMSYMFRNQLYKNGLRFYFSNKTTDLSLEKITELGLRHPLLLNTFHIDRFVLEEDLMAMNREMGAHYIEAAVEQIELTPEFNSIEIKRGEEHESLRGRWLIDGSGTARLLARKLNLNQPVENNFHASVWGHFRCKNRIDELDGAKSRCYGFVTRELSTNHFMGYGYWIWVIPLLDGTVSLGVVYDTRLLFNEGMPNQEQFLAFILAHKGLASLFEKVDLVNFRGQERYSYMSRQFVCGERRFALLADAAAFCDPLYSSGIDSLARQSDWYSELIIADIASKNRSQQKNVPTLVEKANRANTSLKHHYQLYLDLVLGSNSVIGSAELMMLRYVWDAYTHNLHLLWPYIDGNLDALDVEKLPISGNLILQIIRTLAANFRTLANEWQKRGLYYRHNEGMVSPRDGIFGFVDLAVTTPLTAQNQRMRFAWLQEIIHFISMSQLELYFERKDLSCCQELIANIRLDHFASFATSIEKNEAFFFQVMKKLIKELDEASSELLFWKKWIERTLKGIQTEYCGPNFNDLTKRIHYIPQNLWKPIASRKHPDPVIEEISLKYRLAVMRAPAYLKGLKSGQSQEKHLPFLVEAVAAGLVISGQTVLSVSQKLVVEFGESFLPLIAIGCGVGLYNCREVKRLDELEKSKMHSTQFIENLLDGYGFAMALAMHLESHSLFFPNSEKRQALVRGFGRSITYFPCSENRAEKYRDYFNYMALYPSDLESFYKGVGFSLGFSQSLKKEDERLEEFKTDEKFHLLQGLQEAEIALTKMASTR